jgi:hypothetical protein
MNPSWRLSRLEWCMPGLSEQKADIVRRLVETSPDRVVGALHAALAGAGGDAALSDVRRLVAAETEDRRLRNLVLQPAAPLFRVPAGRYRALAFPPKALSHLWRGLKEIAPDGVAAAAAQLADLYAEEIATEPLDALCLRAGDALRARAPDAFATAARLCDEAMPDGAGLLVKCIDLIPVCRSVMPRLGDWITRTTEASTAAARLAYKDAVNISEDAGVLFFEMLAAQLAHPWMVLRVVSAVMDRPGESYFAGSEFAPFALQLMDDIDAGLQSLASIDVAAGPSAGVTAAKRVETISLQIHEIEEGIEIKAGGPWAPRLAAQKHALASKVEERLRGAEKAAQAALPSHAARVAKILKQVPRLDVAPEAKAVTEARALLTFALEVRSSANHGGFAASRGKVMETVSRIVDEHVEEILAELRSGDPLDTAIAGQHLETAADLRIAIGDGKAAELIRRRAAAAMNARPSEGRLVL